MQVRLSRRKLLGLGVGLVGVSRGQAPLEPGRDYFYRFIYRGVRSPIGRTRTLHPSGTMPERLRLGLITCQEFGSGYYGALAHLAREELDAVIHLGDFIYEYSGDPRYRRERFLGRAFRLPSARPCWRP